MKYILQGIGIVFTLITSFLGLLYFLRGDILISGLVSAVIVVILYFLIDKFIKSKNEISKNKISILSIVLWTFYVLLSIPISVSLVHCLNVEINAKKEIKSLANDKINSLNNMVAAYNSDVDAYLTTLGVDIKAKLTNYTNDSIPSNAHLDVKDDLMKPPYNLEDATINGINKNNYIDQVNNIIMAKRIIFNKTADTLKTENSNFLMQYGNVFNNWSRLKLNNTFYQLDEKLINNRNKLKTSYAKYTEPAKESFEFPFSSDQGLMDKPIELWQQYTPYYLLLIVIFFNILLLLPYFLEPASGSYIDTKGVTNGGWEI